MVPSSVSQSFVVPSSLVEASFVAKVQTYTLAKGTLGLDYALLAMESIMAGNLVQIIQMDFKGL